MQCEYFNLLGPILSYCGWGVPVATKGCLYKPRLYLCSSGTSSRWRRRDKTEEFDEMEDDEEDEDECHDDYDVDDEEAIPVDDDEQLDDILDNDLSW